MCVHGACLAFTAWALVATSAPDSDTPGGPEVDCFTGVPASAALVVTTSPLPVTDSSAMFDGGSAATSDGGSAATSDGGSSGTVDDGAAPAGDGSLAVGSPSCAGIDGLLPGKTLTFNVAQPPGSRPSRAEPAPCYGYWTTSIEGLLGVSFDSPVLPNDSAFTATTGKFSSTTEQACTGWWSIDLRPLIPPDGGVLVSPIDAGAGSWVIERQISIGQAQFCGHAFADRGAVSCKDTFAVESIRATRGF